MVKRDQGWQKSRNPKLRRVLSSSKGRGEGADHELALKLASSSFSSSSSSNINMKASSPPLEPLLDQMGAEQIRVILFTFIKPKERDGGKTAMKSKPGGGGRAELQSGRHPSSIHPIRPSTACHLWSLMRARNVG